METRLVKIESMQLEKVVNEAGLAIQEGEEIKQSYLPFLNQLAETQSQAAKINFDKPAEIDETIARELRLKTVKIRTGAEVLKNSRKKTYLLKGNLEQAAYNLIAASCKLTEEVFINVEKAREIAEKKRLEQLRLDRLEVLKPYTEIEPLALGHMEQIVFDNYLSGLKVAHEQKIAEEKKAEEARLKAIEAEKQRQEEIRLENERLKKEAEEKEKALNIEREKVRKDNEEKERLAEIERKKQAKILADQKEKAEKEKAELFAKAEKERKEKERLEVEIEKKKQDDEKSRMDAEIKAENERKAQIAAEKKAAKAPDKVKLTNAICNLTIPDLELKNDESRLIEKDIRSKFVSFKLWCETQIRTL